MSDSTKRAIRTTIQVLIALLTALPTYLAGASGSVVAVQVLAVAAAVTKLWAFLEDTGVLPAWLRSPVKDSVFSQPTPAVAPEV